MRLPASQLTALRNLAHKREGEEVPWINIADARALSDLGFAERGRAGWTISPAGLAALKAESDQDSVSAGSTHSVIKFGADEGDLDEPPDETGHD